MDVRATTHRARILHRRFIRVEPGPAAEPRTRLRGLAAQALWLGLASGWLELGVILAQRTLVGTVTRVSVRHHWHLVPLGLLAPLATFAAWLAVAAACARGRSRAGRADRAAATLGLFLAFASPLLAVEALHRAAALALAAGLAIRAGAGWAGRREALVRATLPHLAAASVLLGAAAFARVHGAEARALAALGSPTPGTPNVVLVVMDTVRADHLGLHGYPRPTTPNLDALAARAVVFDAARAPSPWTLPSHAAMFTGRWPHELSVDTDRPLDGAHPTLAEFLGRRGYRAGGFVGNTFYANAWFGLDRGFARYEDAREARTFSVQELLRASALGRLLMPLGVRARLWPTTGASARRKTAAEINRDALAWLDRPEGDGRPFFLFLNYMDAHDPYLLPPGVAPYFARASREELLEAQARFFRLSGDPGASEAGRRDAEAALAGVAVDAYDDCLRYLDAQIARLLDELEARGRLEDTWVLITSDHGEHFGEHGRFAHGNSLYRPLIDVPLLIVPPGGSAVAGRRVAEPVSLRDLPATVADLAGHGGPPPFPGRSLRRHWDASAPATVPDDHPLSEMKLPASSTPLPNPPPADRFLTAVHTGRHIYHRGLLGREELYDASDPSESADLAPRPDSAPDLALGRALTDRLLRPPDPAVAP